MKKIILFLILPLLSFNLHKTHISLTKVEYKKENKTLQITSRVFIDDLENALQKKYGTSIELNTERESKETKILIQKYFKDNLNLSLNNHPIKLQFLGKEYDQDIVYVYFEMKNISEFDEMNIKNTLLFDLFDDQQNITKIAIKNYQKTLYLTPKHIKEKVIIE